MTLYFSESRLTQERLREVLNYNQDTGEFTWLLRLSNKTKVGRLCLKLGGDYAKQ
jgi:hypothetical protein